MESDNTIPEKKESFWDKNPGKFRIAVIVIAIILTAMIGANLIRNATTIFSGTHYMMMPSEYYIQESFTYESENETITVPVGSYLLSIDGTALDSASDPFKILDTKSPAENVTLQIFSKDKVGRIMDMDVHRKYIQLSDTVTIRKSLLPDNFIRRIENGTFIGYLEEGGATDIAGIKAGDVLFTINDTAIKVVKFSEGEGMTTESLRHLRSQPSGVPIPYRILRDNREMTINVELAKFGMPIMYVILLISGFLLFLLGLFYGLSALKFTGGRLLFIAMTLMGFNLGIAFSIYPTGYDASTWLRVLMQNFASMMFVPFLLHSLNYFPAYKPVLASKKIYTAVIYAAGSATFLIFAVWYIVDMESLRSWPFLVLISGNIIFYITVSLIHRKKAASEFRTAERIISILWVFIFLILITDSWTQVFGLYKLIPEWFRTYNFTVLVLLVPFYLYVTWKHKIFGIDFKIRRNTQYVSAMLLWKILITAALVLSVYYFTTVNVPFPNIKFSGAAIQYYNIPLEEADNTLWNKVLFLVLSVLAAYVIFRFDRIASSFLDRKFYRGKYDYAAAQTELTRLLEKTFTIESLARIFVRKITEYARLKCTGMMFFTDSDKPWKDKMYCYENGETSEKLGINPSELFNIYTGKSVVTSQTYLSPEAREYMEKHGIKVIIPLKSKNKITGAVFAGEKLSETAIKDEDIEFILTLSLSASSAIENAFLYEELASQERLKHELEIAHRIQVESLPQFIPDVPGLDIAGRSVPAYEVGGDFYDYLNGSPGKFTVIIGDVSGKGTSAALYMSKVQGIFQTLNEFYDSPKKLLEKANYLLYRHIDSKSYITAIGANFDTRQKIMKFARAGHLPVYHYSVMTGEISKMQPGGIGLGLSENRVFELSLEEIPVNYSSGDIFIFITDGITEAMGRGSEQYGEERLSEIVRKGCGKNAYELCDDILESVREFSGNVKQYDDITLVVVKAKENSPISQ